MDKKRICALSFFLWYCILMAIILLTHSSFRSLIKENPKILTFAIGLNIATGVIALISGIAYVFEKSSVYFKTFKKSVLPILIPITVIGGFIIAGYFVLIYYVLPYSTRYLPIQNQISYSSLEVKNFYLSFLYDVFGYPKSGTPATEDDLLQAINDYRKKFSIEPVDQNDVLCTMADKKIRDMLTFAYTTKYQSISSGPSDSADFHTIGQILERMAEIPDANSLLQYRWIRLFSDERPLILDTQWKWGCIKINSSNIAVLFAK